MTREEKELALYCLKASSDYHSEVCEECIKYPNCDHTWQDDVTETIIKALEQEPCEDAISRQAVEEIKELMTDINGDTVYTARMSDIRQLPPVTQQPKTGHWIEVAKYPDGKHKIKCSECESHIFDRGHANSYVVKEKYKYCPNCCAKMVKPQESEEK